MAKTTIEINGESRTFPSKKRMLQVVGREILSSSNDPMTLRQLYYRFVALDLLDNKESQYSYLGTAIKDARINGLIPWNWIEDRTRSTDAGDHNDGKVVSPKSRFNGNLKWFKNSPDRFFRPRWEKQPRYIEVWVEKEALAGVFANVANDLKVISFPNRGYTSITLLKEAADRIKRKTRSGQKATILYFGDFDPSGQDIERNIRDKLQSTFGVSVDVRREALTREQIDDHRLPPQPAKSSDSRYEDFVAKHGDLAVELDALPPEDLQQMIRDAVNEMFDDEIYEEKVLLAQEEDREKLSGLIDGVLNE